MRKIRTFSLFLMFAISILVIQKTAILDYVTSIKYDSLDVSKMDDPLYVEIQKKAKDYEVKPEDARIDPIWKGIPGLNGKKVDVRLSYEQMKKNGTFEETLLVYKETKPKLTLRDLSPAPIYKGREEKQAVSFVINVAWGEEYLPSMLQTLQKQNVKATFFIEGRFAKNNPDIVKMIAEEGHEIGNHSFSHPDMSRMSKEEAYKEIKQTNDILFSITGETPRLFGPPSGAFNKDTLRAVRSLSMETILWTVDTVDWKNPNPVSMKLKIISKSHAGAIVLMHPTKVTDQTLEEMIVGVQNKGFVIIPVSELISEKRQFIEN